TTTSSSSCTFALSGQSLGTGSKSSALQIIKKEQNEGEEQKKEEVEQQQQKPQQQQQQQQQQQEEEQHNQVRAQLSSMHRAIGGADAPQEEVEATSTPTNTNRCAKCNKKLGLTGGFPCRCGGVYCAVHRYSDRHECSFDYRELGASEIRRDNPQIIPSKLKKL
ncbi:hypothetical protein KR200_006206, partial [Drosophila serrata]